MEDLSKLRKSYERAELDESAAANDPLRQFDAWMTEAMAAQVPEPNAMTLATVGPDQRPSTRIVLVKGFDARARSPVRVDGRERHRVRLEERREP